MTDQAMPTALDLPMVDPLPPERVCDFLRTVGSRRTAAPDAPARMLETFVERMARDGFLDARELAVLTAFGRFCLEALVEQCSNLDPAVPPEPGSLSCLLVAPRSGPDR